MGYHPGERGRYNPSVLQAAGLTDEGSLERLRERLKNGIDDDVEELIGRCLG